MHFPRPLHLGKAFSRFDVEIYEPHVQYLTSLNAKGRAAELKFCRNIVSYLLEAAVHSFKMIHV